MTRDDALKKIKKCLALKKTTLLLEQYKSANWPDSTTAKPKDRTKGRNVSLNDFGTGVRHGQLADLNHGVGGTVPQGLLT